MVVSARTTGPYDLFDGTVIAVLEGRRIAGLMVFGALAMACAGADAAVTLERSLDAAPPSSALSTTAATSTTQATTTTAPPPATAPPTTVAATTTVAPTTTRPFIERVVVDTGFTPYAVIENLTLLHPAAGVERIGFHEASHDGARQQDPTASTARAMTLETRDRGTPDRTAADIVVVPDTEIRSPVTGTVVRSGSYTLYCDHVDEYVVIEPDDRPGWEVKMLHIAGVHVARGHRVEAGVTPIALHSRVLPFESQIDEFTAEPSWPHVHIEVVDPTIPDRPNPGGGGGCP